MQAEGVYLKVYIGMTNLCDEPYCWRLNRIAGGDDNVESEATAFVCGVCGAQEDGLPVEQVVLLHGLEQLEMGPGGRVLLDGEVLLEHPAVHGGRHVCVCRGERDEASRGRRRTTARRDKREK